ncbi:MaoC family dehydratase N-terminal domain-containing protein [Erythrobacter sp. SDW2]|uniref:FAS1-like dehydratase domain-containing protein n=1 Tax=Erythrobacter sp. SDW2 TaxID=2907154 RepID=UPI001F208F79|nr:MaoC family dehydratase N-terminal domain-containing protein [Erythrobacter sp. SDW2]UIP07491.1 MaoC family dehydratase N-terminal domain-containing protein [Erythrobacter sp. SDW2]
MGQWDSWIGREVRQSDRLDEALAARWLATFDLVRPQPALMPQGIHFALCTPEAPTRRLGLDGHPSRDDSPQSFFPPVSQPRRMWAASDIRFRAPLAIGAVVSRTSRIVSITERDGASGQLVFVEVEHETSANGTLSVIEKQTLVYRDEAAPDAPLSPPEPGQGSFDGTGWDRTRTLTPSETLLFRYSALTFNTHRIHYDLPYARDVERYRGLVVHGPLIASLLLQLAAEEFGDNRLTRFNFRAVSPAICGEPLTLALRQSGDGIELGSFASDGRQTVKATASLA